eukprot:9372-Eustigmatos_ZCMA.PRE.1
MADIFAQKRDTFEPPSNVAGEGEEGTGGFGQAVRVGCGQGYDGTAVVKINVSSTFLNVDCGRKSRTH